MTDPKTQQVNTSAPGGKPSSPPPPQKPGDKKAGSGGAALLYLSLVLILAAALFAGYWARNNAESARPVASAAEESVVDEEIIITAESGSESATGELVITSDVRGADVYLNGKRVGKTPHRQTPLNPGDYQVRVEHAGYESFEGQVHVETGPETINADLRPLAGGSKAASVKVKEVAREEKEEAAATPVDIRPRGENVAVNHRHRIGSCEGVLRINAEGLAYESDHKDAFFVAFADVEELGLDGDKLTLKVREGRKYDFNERSDNVEALGAFYTQARETVPEAESADQ